MGSLNVQSIVPILAELKYIVVKLMLMGYGLMIFSMGCIQLDIGQALVLIFMR